MVYSDTAASLMNVPRTTGVDVKILSSFWSYGPILLMLSCNSFIAQSWLPKTGTVKDYFCLFEALKLQFQFIVIAWKIVTSALFKITNFVFQVIWVLEQW